MQNKANGPSDCLVAEMLENLTMESVYEITHWFVVRSQGECRSLEVWRVLRFVFLKKPDDKSEERLARIPCDRIAQRSFQVVHFGSCSVIARRTGA